MKFAQSRAKKPEIRSRLLPLAAVLSLLTAGLVGTASPSVADTAEPKEPTLGDTITNNTFWKDTEGNPIFSQGGGVFDFEDLDTGTVKHYWYGVRYAEAVAYEKNPTSGSSTDTFEAVTAYSSDDLVNWDYEGDVLTRAEVSKYDDPDDISWQTAWLGRTGVAYVEELGVYALFIQHEYGRNSTPTVDKQVLVATSDSPEGPFTFDRRLNMKDYNLGTSNTGDQTVFTDTDGTSYLVYSYGSGRNSIWLAEIGVKNGQVDLLNPTKIYQGAGREGNTMFTYNGKYYMTASALHGWNTSPVYYLVADNVLGPYTPANNMLTMDGSSDDYAHVTQTGFYYTLHGSEQDTVIYAGDRWAGFAGNGLGYNQWVPLSFDGATPHFNSLSQWNLDHDTGQWSIHEENNWVLNPAFEADRILVGNVRGWTYSGDTASIKNEADKDGRVGNFHMSFSNSTSSYSATLSQDITLPNGTYALHAEARNGVTAEAAEAAMYASSGGETYTASFKDLGPLWGGSLDIRDIPVVNGKIQVGFATENVPAKQWINFDDITLIRQTDSDTSLKSVTVAGVPVDLGAAPLQATVPDNREVSADTVVVETTSPFADAQVTVDDDTISIVVTPEYGDPATHTITVTWQTDEVTPTSVEVAPGDLWFSSDYYSSVNQAATAPTEQLSATVVPSNVTDQSVEWGAVNDLVASVDESGRVTAAEPGRTLVTATTTTGGKVDAVPVHVPITSESFDNRGIGSAWGIGKIGDYAGAMSDTITSDGSTNYVAVSGSGSGLRAGELAFPEALSGDQMTVAFDFNVGAPSSSNGSYVTLVDSVGNRYLSLQTKTGAELEFAVGGVSDINDTTNRNSPLTNTTRVGSGFTAAGTWYNVRVTVDEAAGNLTLTVTSRTNPALTATHEVALPDQDYSGTIDALQFWMTRASGSASWSPMVDNFSLYGNLTPTTELIKVTSLPDRQEYLVGEEFDPTGLEVTSFDSEGTARVLDNSEYTVTGFDSDTVGDQTLTVALVADPSVTTTFTVTVSEKETPADPEVTSIEVTSLPEKTEYEAGEDFDPTGLEITATLSNDTTRVLDSSEYTVTGFDSDTVGDQTLTATLVADPTVTATFTVTVTKESTPVDPVDPEEPTDPVDPVDPEPNPSPTPGDDSQSEDESASPSPTPGSDEGGNGDSIPGLAVTGVAIGFAAVLALALTGAGTALLVSRRRATE